MDARMKAVLSSCILRCLLGKAIHTSQTKGYKRAAEAPKTCTDDGTQEKGASVFDFYNISYNAGYTKYRGAKKPSFSGFGPFRRLLSLLGWLGRFFAFCTVVLFECIALYVFISFFCFTLVPLLSVKTFLTSIAITFLFRPLIFFKSVHFSRAFGLRSITIIVHVLVSDSGVNKSVLTPEMLVLLVSINISQLEASDFSRKVSEPLECP